MGCVALESGFVTHTHTMLWNHRRCTSEITPWRQNYTFARSQYDEEISSCRRSITQHKEKRKVLRR